MTAECSACGDTQKIYYEGREMPCPYCDPAGARAASAIYNPVLPTTEEES